jgi:type II secretory pathway component PulK
MTSSSCVYHEDFYTLQALNEHSEMPLQLIREIQKHGFMLPEMVKFGSSEIEIYSTLDGRVCKRVAEALEKYDSLSLAIAAAEEHVVEVYNVAHGKESFHADDSSNSGHLPQRIQRKKLYTINELLQTLGIDEERFREMRQYIEIVPSRLVIPGQVIDYFGEDDYLRLRYIVTLTSQGCPMEEAAGVAYDWGMHELW